MNVLDRKPLPFRACFVKNGESPHWTPFAIRCPSFGCREVIFLTPQIVEEFQGTAQHYGYRENEVKCPRCHTTQKLLTEDENPRPPSIELPVVQPSAHAGHRALVAWLTASHLLLPAEHYLAHDLFYYSRLTLEESDFTEFAAVIRSGNIAVIGRGTNKAPERLDCEYGCGQVLAILRIVGEMVTEMDREEADTWLCGEDDNRRLAEVPARVGTFRVPDFETLLSSLPRRVRKLLNEQENKRRRSPESYRGWSLREAYNFEVLNLVRYAGRCEEPCVSMSLFDQGGHQWQCHFSVSDRALPKKDEWNLHGHNTSQWAYAGAMVVDDETGEVSTHH